MSKTFAKISGVVVTLVLAGAVAVSSASALTAADIQLLVSLGVIPADKADAALALTGGSSSSSSSSSSCGYAYTRNLTVGSKGADVVALQTYLESKGFLTIPAGVSKGYFGPLTKSSLASYQASMGISPAVGYFGPITMGRVSADCASTPMTGGDDDDDDMDDDDDSSDLSGGEASLTDYDRKSKYTNEELEEGETGKVFAAEFEVEDGDAKVERVDVQIEAVTDNNEDEPWNQIDELVLYLNGDEVASMDVDDEDDWSRESSTDSSTTNTTRAYEVRFKGLKSVFEDGDDVLVEVEVVTANQIDDSDLDQTWKVWIPTDGIRAVDGEGIDQYTGSNSESTNFTVEAAQDGDVSIREDDDDPDASILVVDTDDKSPEYEVFRFEIDNDDADIFLNELTIVASTSDSDIDDVISDIMVEVDGEEFSYDTASTTDGNVGEYTFDFEDNDEEIPVEEDETLNVVVLVEINSAGTNFSNYADASVLQVGVGKINGANYGSVGVEAEGQQSGDSSTVSGRQQGSVHTLRTEGIVVEGVSESAEVDEAEVSGEEEKGIFEIEVQVTALEEDAYINDTVATTSSTTAGFVALITNAGTAFTGTAEAFISEDSADSKVNGRHKVPEGSSDKFTIRVEVNPTSTSEGKAYGIELSTINFASTSDGSLAEYTVPDEEEFETKKITID